MQTFPPSLNFIFHDFSMIFPRFFNFTFFFFFSIIFSYSMLIKGTQVLALRASRLGLISSVKLDRRMDSKISLIKLYSELKVRVYPLSRGIIVDVKRTLTYIFLFLRMRVVTYQPNWKDFTKKLYTNLLYFLKLTMISLLACIRSRASQRQIYLKTIVQYLLLENFQVRNSVSL